MRAVVWSVREEGGGSGGVAGAAKPASGVEQMVCNHGEGGLLLVEGSDERGEQYNMSDMGLFMGMNA